MAEKEQREMSDAEIREVFEEMNLPTTTPLPPPAAAPQQPSAPVVFFTVSGHSPPLKTP